jgi:hypothetical protein
VLALSCIWAPAAPVARTHQRAPPFAWWGHSLRLRRERERSQTADGGSYLRARRSTRAQRASMFALRPAAVAAGDDEGGVLEGELGECGAVVFARRVLAPAGLHRVVGDVDLVVVVDVLGEDQRHAFEELLAGRCPDRPGASAFTLFEERLLELARGVHNARRMTLGPDGLEGYAAVAKASRRGVSGLRLEAKFGGGGHGLVQLWGGGVGADGVVLAKLPFRLAGDGGIGRLLCGRTGS